MASKWRVFRKPIIAGRSTVETITKAAVVLHNFIKMSVNNAGTNCKYLMLFEFVLT